MVLDPESLHSSSLRDVLEQVQRGQARLGVEHRDDAGRKEGGEPSDQTVLAGLERPVKSGDGLCSSGLKSSPPWYGRRRGVVTTRTKITRSIPAKAEGNLACIAWKACGLSRQKCEERVESVRILRWAHEDNEDTMHYHCLPV